MEGTLTNHALDRRAGDILRSFAVGQPVTAETVHELAELGQALEDAPIKPVVIARLTLERADGTRSIVEIRSDATSRRFYRYHKQVGRKRSTKTLLRTSERTEARDLLAIAERAEKWGARLGCPVVKRTLRVIQRRAYRRLLDRPPYEPGPVSHPGFQHTVVPAR